MSDQLSELRKHKCQGTRKVIYEVVQAHSCSYFSPFVKKNRLENKILTPRNVLDDIKSSFMEYAYAICITDTIPLPILFRCLHKARTLWRHTILNRIMLKCCLLELPCERLGLLLFFFFSFKCISRKKPLQIAHVLDACAKVQRLLHVFAKIKGNE